MAETHRTVELYAPGTEAEALALEAELRDHGRVRPGAGREALVLHDSEEDGHFELMECNGERREIRCP